MANSKGQDVRSEIFLNTAPLPKALELWRTTLQGSGLWSALPAEDMAVTECLGRTTAEAVHARISSPFYHCSAMDGYAVRFHDTFGASETRPVRLRLGRQAVYVDTGDPMPELTNEEGADGDTPFNAVIMVEDTNLTDGYIEITAPATPWNNVRTIGEDIVATELIAPEGHTIRPVDMGAMLAGGITTLRVRRKPRVAIIPTGTEIVEPGGDLKRGEIIESSSHMLAALVTEWGGQPIRLDIVPDDPRRLKSALTEACAMADLVAVIAGASAGSEDYTERTIRELGTLILHGLDIRPGKPCMLGMVKDTAVIGLPGYPVATHLCFNLFARPLIKRQLGLEDSEAVFGAAQAKLSRQVASHLGHEEFLRVKVGRVGRDLIATPLGRGAGLMMSLVRADGIIRIPASSEGLASGTEVEVELARPMEEINNTIVSIGSHDNSMDVLANFLRKRHPRYTLSSAHVGSMGGLMALRKDEAHIAPTHLLDAETGEYNVPFIMRLLPGKKIKLITLVHRTQGLMVPRGNPKGIKGLADLVRSDITFINRQRGAGTRLLLDKTLGELGIVTTDVAGYEREEYTHMAVASAVLTGVADTGLGVLSAALALGLEFIPVASERYDLALPADLLDNSPALQALVDIIQGDTEFRDAVANLGGYDISEMGREVI